MVRRCGHFHASPTPEEPEQTASAHFARAEHEGIGPQVVADQLQGGVHRIGVIGSDFHRVQGSEHPEGAPVQGSGVSRPAVAVRLHLLDRFNFRVARNLVVAEHSEPRQTSARQLF